MPPGRHGAYLRIDVTTGEAHAVAVPEAVHRRFPGGVGLGTWICLREGGAQAGPLEPAAPVVFAFSPLVGTPLTTSAKFAVVSRSPLTGLLNDAVSSSHFAIAGKRTGYDALVLAGRAPALARVVVDDGEVEVRPAPELAGRPAAECGLDGFRTAAIGPAGERLVRFSNLTNEGRHAGRGGLGAVLGAKNVKALSVRGTRVPPLHDPRGVVAAARDLSRRSLGPATAKYRELGTIENLLVFNRLSVLPTRNFREGSFEAAPELAAEALHARERVGRASCAACTIGCEHIFRTPSGDPVRIEYESLFALGSLLGISDRGAVLAAARKCDELGLDTISAGGTLAVAMEAGCSGLGFGDADGVLEALDAIAGGGPLAEGAKRFAASIGRPELAMHVKGLEIPGYDPRRLPAMALGFAVGTRGADHNRSGAYELDFSPSGFDVERLVALEDRNAAMDSLILCKFLRGVFADFAFEAAELLRLVTGERVDLAAAGRDVCDLRKVFNQRAGWRREDDTLPARLLAGALSPAKLAAMIGKYYRARGWTDGGRVPERRAEELAT